MSIYQSATFNNLTFPLTNTLSTTVGLLFEPLIAGAEGIEKRT